MTQYRRQAVVADAEYARGAPIAFGSDMIHEFSHLKAHQTTEVRTENPDDTSDSGTPRVKPVSFGISKMSTFVTTDKIGHHEHFLGVHEALMALGEMRGWRKMLELPEFEKERAWISSDKYRELAKEYARKELGISPEYLDTYAQTELKWISEDGKHFHSFGYKGPRRVLEYVCRQIKEHFDDARFANEGEKFETWENVLDEFFKGHFSRKNFRRLNELVKAAFGTLAFRVLGNMDSSNKSASLHLETMRAFRRERLKDAEKGR